MNKEKFYLFLSIFLGLTLVLMIIPFNLGHGMSMNYMHNSFLDLRDDMHHDLLPQGDYRCCLENPCNTCLALDPWHGEGPTCDCLTDLVNGEAPCGECVGGILAGRGNPYLADYFPESIAEEVGEEHLETLKKIIAEKYETYNI